MANVPNEGLMLQKTRRWEHKARSKDIIRRFMHNSSDARLDWILTSTAHILISPTISCSHPSYRNHL